jgi:cysteine synthase A
MAGRYDSILDTIGHTPVVRIDTLSPEGVEVYVKIESFNPGGSVKDRLALGVIEDAERRGVLKPGQTVVEGTSGNTGIGLAVVCARKGYPLVVTMAENFSIERRKLMRFLGAKVVLTPAAQKGSGMLRKAAELAEAHGWFLARQFENEANPDIHSRTTAVEILEDFEGDRLDYWVTGFGTGGTLTGVARVLKRERPETKIVVCEPDNVPLLGSGIAQERGADGVPTASHPAFRPHLMQGWSPDFIPKIVAEAVDASLIDEIVPIAGVAALQAARDLARSEGIFVGISSGATLAGALEVARRAQPGSKILCMLPDTGERYMTTPLFEDIATDMTAEEIALSKSTPNVRFDVATSPPPANDEEEAPALTTAAVSFVDEAIASTAEPVVMFALEWCEFCWSLRKLFERLGIAYRSVDLDSAENQKDDWGGQVRAAVTARTDMQTIPQLFVGGEFIGGCTEAFDAYNEGQLATLLQDSGVAFDAEANLEAYDFLPKWLEPR